jgi:hypothetical protein
LIERVVETTERNPTFLAMLALILSAAGRMEEVHSILHELLARYDPDLPTGVAHSVGEIYAALGDGDNATEWLNRGIEEGFPARLHLLFPGFAPIRGHPEFAAIIEKVGLPALWADPAPGGPR